MISTSLFAILIIAHSSVFSYAAFLSNEQLVGRPCHTGGLNGIVNRISLSRRSTDPIDIITIPDTVRKYTFKCLEIIHDGPSLTATQEAVCSQDATVRVCTAGADGGDWSCVVVPAYTVTQRFEHTIGALNGPLMRVKMTWQPNTQASELCYPRDLTVAFIGNEVGVIKSNLATIVALSICGPAVFLLIAFFGFYRLRKVFNKFRMRGEHRARGSAYGPRGDGATDGSATNNAESANLPYGDEIEVEEGIFVMRRLETYESYGGDKSRAVIVLKPPTSEQPHPPPDGAVFRRTDISDDDEDPAIIIPTVIHSLPAEALYGHAFEDALPATSGPLQTVLPVDGVHLVSVPLRRPWYSRYTAGDQPVTLSGAVSTPERPSTSQRRVVPPTEGWTSFCEVPHGHNLSPHSKHKDNFRQVNFSFVNPVDHAN